MLRDALPAKKAAALGTARNRLPLHMIVTTLVSDIRHGLINIVPEFFVKPLAEKIAVRLDHQCLK